MGGTEPKGAGSAHLHRVTAVIARRETPGPIPNPEAKPLSADGTATARSWESRTPPDHTCQSSHPHPRGWLDCLNTPTPPSPEVASQQAVGARTSVALALGN